MKIPDPGAAPSKDGVSVFFCYSHRDEELLDQLRRHLSALKRQGLIRSWHDRKIGPGAEWKSQIHAHLETAEIILLLVSADFIASDYCYDVEMKRALERHDANDALVIPVILRAVEWSDTPIRRLQALPKDARPVASWPSVDEALASVASEIRKAVLQLVDLKSRQGSGDRAPQPAAIQREAARTLSGIEYMYVPAGTFTMGTSQARIEVLRRSDPSQTFANECPEHKVSTEAFYIGRYPITNAQYREFIMDTKHPVPFRDDDWSRPFNWDPDRRTYPEGKAAHPTVLLSWHDAIEYCRWLGVRLPTEAEWEIAARGVQHLEWPWGNSWQEGRCNTEESGLRDTTPVGLFSLRGDSPYGVADMAGNVWEWCSSFLDPYPYVFDDGREADGVAASRVLRGGAWGLDRWKARSAFRGGTLPDDYGFTIGFRVALDAGDEP